MLTVIKSRCIPSLFESEESDKIFCCILYYIEARISLKSTFNVFYSLCVCVCLVVHYLEVFAISSIESVMSDIKSLASKSDTKVKYSEKTVA